jgi:death-on-curing family protein
VGEEAAESEPIYLELADALELYAAIVGGTSAQAADQLRNQAGLESALSRPRAYAHYEAADIALQAAVLAHGIAESQTFIDGNKRLALVALLTFLELNGYRVDIADVDLAAWILSLSAGTTPQQLAQLMRDAMRPISGGFLVRSAELSSGLELPYVEQGEQSGVAVVFLHAYGDSWRSFEPILLRLPSSIHAFAVTQRGHGDADRPASGYRVEDFAADLAAFMDAVAVEAAVLFASSSASFTVQRFAVDHPGRTLGIVLSGAPWSLGYKPDAGGLLEAVSNLRDPVDPDFVRRFVESTIFRQVPPDFLEQMVSESCKLPAHVWKATLEGLLEAIPAAQTATVRAPTLILWGERDEILPRSDQETLAAAIPDSRLVTYAGTGHMVHWEAPERVAADVVALAERVRPSTGS